VWDDHFVSAGGTRVCVMSTPIGNLVGGAAAAAILAIVMLIPTIAGVSTWKWMLGFVGLLLWFLAEWAESPRL